MSDDNAEKVQIRAYNEITRADYTPESIEAAIGKLWRAAVASRDAEVLDDGLRESRIAELRKQLAAERTRADKAEAAVRRVARMHREKTTKNAHGLYLICDYDKTAWPCRTYQLLAAVPVEPQGDHENGAADAHH